MWQQMVDEKHKLVGAKLTDYGDSIDRKLLGVELASTIVTDVKLEPNGEDSKFFSIVGKDFTCGFDVHTGGIDGSNCKDGVMAFAGYGGHRFEVIFKQ